MEGPPIGGEDPERAALDLSRHRRALSLIVLSVIAIAATELAYVHPPSIATLKSAQPAAAPRQVSMSMPGDTGRAPRLPLTAVFQSPTMHYAIKFPAGWTVTPATQVWRGEQDLWGRPNVDELNGKSVMFAGTSEPLPSGQSPAQWIAGFLATAEANKCGIQEYMDFLGLVGLIFLGGCSSTDLPGRVYEAAVVVGARGYSFSMKGKVDQPFFVSMLRTINFAP